MKFFDIMLNVDKIEFLLESISVPFLKMLPSHLSPGNDDDDDDHHHHHHHHRRRRRRHHFI